MSFSKKETDSFSDFHFIIFFSHNIASVISGIHLERKQRRTIRWFNIAVHWPVLNNLKNESRTASGSDLSSSMSLSTKGKWKDILCRIYLFSHIPVSILILSFNFLSA